MPEDPKPVAATCPACGRDEVVSTTVPKRDDASRAPGPDGKPVPDGAHVQICTLCGTVVKVLGGSRGASGRPSKKRAASAKRKPTAAAKRAASSKARRPRGQAGRRHSSSRRSSAAAPSSSPTKSGGR